MTSPNPFCEITPELLHLANLSETCAVIDPDLYNQYDVKRGLRDLNGKGVLVGQRLVFQFVQGEGGVVHAQGAEDMPLQIFSKGQAGEFGDQRGQHFVADAVKITRDQP